MRSLSLFALVTCLLLAAHPLSGFSPLDKPTSFSIQQETSFGQSVFLTGDTLALGVEDPLRAIKLSPHAYPTWRATIALPPGETVNYRYILRTDSGPVFSEPANAIPIEGSATSLIVPGTPAPPRSGTLRYFSGATSPVLVILDEDGAQQRLPMVPEGPGREAGEQLFTASLSDLPPVTGNRGRWRFRIDLGGGDADTPQGEPSYETVLSTLWLQDGQIYDYKPAPSVSPSRVLKIPNFGEALASRPLYIYLPRGYAEHTERRYPVLFMHDGQNVFQAFVQDSFAGSWRADEAADRLIAGGLIQELIIVGVANGQGDRIEEYLPPYVSFVRPTVNIPAGRADETFAFYRDEVTSHVEATYRTLPGRDNRATAGSSLGGLFTAYIAWEHPDFARHHAALSTSYWITQEGDGGPMETIEKFRTESPRDIRLWIDSGTEGSTQDGLSDTYTARDALLQNGYILGSDLWHHVHHGGGHNEPSWASRFPLVLEFLFPILAGNQPDPDDDQATAWLTH
ncbi:MAG: alpha/beta hydrolase-fold protein [Sumerlaeia bacterium]